MASNFKEIIWHQFGAAIDMLDNAIKACPDGVWDAQTEERPFWYVVYHTLFWLDFYLSGTGEGFKPPPPFGLEELDPAGVLPERPYTKDELRTYLKHGRNKCRVTIESMTNEKAYQLFKFGRVDLSFAELLLYNMRHVQHHAGQLNLVLRQTIDSAPGWAFRAKGQQGAQ